MNPTKKILIVEDEISLINVLYDKFTKEGFTVIKAKDGKEGLAVALSDKPDLILLDINLPVMDGMAMLKELREHESGKNTEVILLTNSMNRSMVAEALEYGSHDYLVKSDWKLEDLVTLVQNKLK